MSYYSNIINKIKIFAFILILFIIMTNNSALAQYSNLPLGGPFQAERVENTEKSWGKIDGEVRDCLTMKFRFQLQFLIQQGVMPYDHRLIPYIQSCQQIVQQTALKRQADKVAQARDKKAKQAADAAAQANREARQQELTAKYGNEKASEIINGQVHIGMSKEELIDAKGQPDSKELIPPNDELWRYGSDKIALSDGKVSYISH